jgi:two-component system cell cycle response regulator
LLENKAMANIVVIEDTPANLELMCYLLSAFGHNVMPATDGDEGLELTRAVVPELIICDVHMPKVDGYEVARILKSDPNLSNIPLLAVTALAMVGDREKGLKAGFDGYLYKPIDPQTFVSEVECYLNIDRHGALSQPQLAHETQPADAIRAKRGKILVVDDTMVNLELLSDILKPFGYQVWLAHSVAEGYALACKNTPDLILSDLHMPDEDGTELLRLIKSNAVFATIPFVFISSTVRDEKEREAALRFGATSFLLRPIEPAELLAEIASIMARQYG